MGDRRHTFGQLTPQPQFLQHAVDARVCRRPPAGSRQQRSILFRGRLEVNCKRVRDDILRRAVVLRRLHLQCRVELIVVKMTVMRLANGPPGGLYACTPVRQALHKVYRTHARSPDRGQG